MALQVNELKDRLKDRGLSTVGLKAVLCARLKESFEQERKDSGSAEATSSTDGVVQSSKPSTFEEKKALAETEEITKKDKVMEKQVTD